MSNNTVILKGYYGYGNLGDDVLMLVTFRWARERFPGAKILISSDSPDAGYLTKLVGESTEVIRSDQSIEADWIIHGGGGVYFDFKEGTRKFSVLNKFIRAIGYGSFRNLYTTYRAIRNRKVNQARVSVGFGIGVGTYTASSRKFYHDILYLSGYDLLLVRDTESLEQVRRYGFKYPVYCYTDIAFLHSYWNTIFRKQPKGKKVGIVLRDWKYDNHLHLKAMEEAVRTLQANQWKIKFYSFDRRADSTFIELFSKTYEVTSWDPAGMTLTEFLNDFSTSGIVITSRAHGAIIAACLGIPAICLAIEPKLEKISSMLKKSSLLIRAPFAPSEITEVVEGQYGRLTELQRLVDEDVNQNHSLMREGMEIIHKFQSAKERG